MAEIAKIIRVIGQSPTSFAEAAQVAVREAAKTCATSTWRMSR
jgi:flavin-binding protein dodecin